MRLLIDALPQWHVEDLDFGRWDDPGIVMGYVFAPAFAGFWLAHPGQKGLDYLQDHWDDPEIAEFGHWLQALALQEMN